MDHAAVVAGLVFGDRVLGFEHGDLGAACLNQRKSGSKADDAAANNCHFCFICHGRCRSEDDFSGQSAQVI